MSILRPLLLLTGLSLAACAGAPRDVWLNPGTPAFRAETDLAACRAEVDAALPRRSAPPRIAVGGRSCSGNICIGAVQGDVFGADDYAARRISGMGACMGARGYRLASLPACRGTATPLESQPYDLRGLCVANGRIAAP